MSTTDEHAELRAELRELREMIGAVNARVDSLHARIDKAVDSRAARPPGPPTPRPGPTSWGVPG